MNRQPNILFIFTDQQARRTMKVYGNDSIRTPNMDSLAENGVTFQNAYCTSPVCSPARASLMTGRMPHEVDVHINDVPLREGVPTMGNVFRDAGYETAYVGKWHLPKTYEMEPEGIRGFRNLVLPDDPLLLRHLGIRTDDHVADAAIDFVEQPHNDPFLLCVSIHNPHDICYWLMGGNDDLLPGVPDRTPLPRLPENFTIDPQEPAFIRMCRQRDFYGQENTRTKGWTGDQWRIYLNMYHSLVEHADARLGRILQALRKAGLEEDTLIVFTSDHGEGMAGHHWVVKLMLYEEPVTVPFLVSWKGVIPSGVFDTAHLVSGLDLLPTLCDYAGVAPPEGLAGQSLRTLIESPGEPGHDFVVAQLQPDPRDMDLKGRMIRTRRYKYLAFSAGERPEMLFHLERDPGETVNLVSSPHHAAELSRHRSLLSEWVQQNRDPFVCGAR